MDSLSPEKRAEIVEAVRGFIGTPFHHQGRKPGVGLDCGGLVVCAIEAVGGTIADTKAYSRQPWSRRLKAHLDSVLIPSETGDIQPGSVLLFWLHRPKIQQHIGLATGPGTFVHAWWNHNVVVESRLNDYFRKRISQVYEIPWLPSS